MNTMVSNWNQIVITNAFLIFAFYLSSVGLVFYQQWFLKMYAYPFYVTAFNQLTKFTFSALFRIAYNLYTGEKRVSITWQQNLRFTAVLGLVGGIHTSLSNYSLELNTVSLFTISKSTSIVFILMFVIALGLEKYNWKIVTIVAMIAIGLFLFTYRLAQFYLIGFTIALVTSFVSGIRWTLAQYVFQKSKIGIQNPIDLMYYVDLWVFILVSPAVCLVEGPNILHKISTTTTIFDFIMVSLISAVLTFIMEITKYLVIRRTSSLTVSVLGIVKEIATLILAVAFLGDKMSLINAIGMVLCISGVICHATYKFKCAKRSHYKEILGLNKVESNESWESISSISDSEDSTIKKSISYMNLCNP